MKRSWWLMGGLVGAVGAIACTGELVDTVYFNNPAVDFGEAPSPLTVPWWGEQSTRPPDRRVGYNYRDWEAEEKRELQAASLEKQAQAAIKAKNYSLAKKLTEQELALNPESPDVLRDRVLVLSLPVSRGLADYLAARAATTTKVALASLNKVPSGPYSPFVSYYRGELTGRVSYFEEVARRPSVIRGRAIIMSARGLVSAQFPYEAKARVSTSGLLRAKGYINQIVSNPAYNRFAWSARGLLARIDFAQGRYGAATVKYLGLIQSAKSDSEYDSATVSLRMSLARIKSADAAVIRESILASPALFEPYAEFRIYHTGVEDGAARPKSFGDLASLAKFGQQVLAANPKAAIKAEVTARLAEIAYHSGEFKTAMMLADKSLATPNGDRRDLARYVAAGARFRLKQLPAAVTLLDDVSNTFKGSYLMGAAKELKALCQQEQLDFAGALDTYRDLRYDIDIAYLLDVRMSVDQIREYREARPKDPQRDWLTLALGYRLMRENKLAEAEAEFASIPDASRTKLAQVGDTDYRWNDTPGIDVIPDPLQTSRDLIQLRGKTDTASDLYALASYYYTKRNLLLYNASLWQGRRQVLIMLNPTVTQREDRLLVAKHCHEHECLFVARAICLEIAKRFPSSPEASKALYRAATSSRRLADFNEWWRQNGTMAELYDSAISLMNRCAAEYPNDPLAANARKYAKAYADEKSGDALQAGFSDVGLK